MNALLLRKSAAFFSLSMLCSFGCAGNEGATVPDSDGDGVLDTLGWAVDEDPRDGEPDLVDANMDGIIDGIGVDRNGDYKIDALGLDTDGDGIIDAIDNNVNGIDDRYENGSQGYDTPSGGASGDTIPATGGHGSTGPVASGGAPNSGGAPSAGGAPGTGAPPGGNLFGSGGASSAGGGFSF